MMSNKSITPVKKKTKDWYRNIKKLLILDSKWKSSNKIYGLKIINYYWLLTNKKNYFIPIRKQKITYKQQRLEEQKTIIYKKRSKTYIKKAIEVMSRLNLDNSTSLNLVTHYKDIWDNKVTNYKFVSLLEVLGQIKLRTKGVRWFKPYLKKLLSILLNKYRIFLKKKKSQKKKVVKLQELKVNGNKLYINLYKLWTLHLINLKILGCVFQLKDLGYKYRKSYKRLFLKKLSSQFIWINKYLSSYLTKKKFIMSWVSFLISKDSTYIIHMLKTLFENVAFKHHKYILIKLKLLLKFLGKFILSQFLVTSLTFEIKGKIGVGGNAKKRKKKYKSGGGISNSFKGLKTSRTAFLIHTDTGVLGVILKLGYIE